MNVTETKALKKVKEILTDAGIEVTTMRNSNLKIWDSQYRIPRVGRR